MEARFNEDSIVEEDVSTILEGVLQSVDKEIRNIWLQSQVLPIVVKIAMTKMERVINWSSYVHDGDIVVDVPLEEYIPDGEPAPASIDTWARGFGIVRSFYAVLINNNPLTSFSSYSYFCAFLRNSSH
jgi:hypothetical protein